MISFSDIQDAFFYMSSAGSVVRTTRLNYPHNHMTHHRVPANLKAWFVLHFLLDVVIAVPLLVSPKQFLELLGWYSIDPFASRIAAAALFAIGIESFLSRNSNAETYLNMLSLKIIWSGAAILGIALSIFQSTYKTTLTEWLLLVIFLIFHFVWHYWRCRVKKLLA